MPATVYLKAMTNLFNGEIDLTDNTIKVALLTNAYTPDQDTHEFFDDVNANEISVTGYTAGGATLSNKNIAEDTANNRSTFDNTANVTWTFTGTGTVRYVIIYKDTGTPSTSPLLYYDDLGSDTSRTDENFVYEPNASGMLRMTAS